MRKLVLLLAVPAALVLGLAGPASAASFSEYNYTTKAYDDGHPWSQWARAAYGNAAFEFYGDRIWVQDNKADHMIVGAQWKIGTRSGICVNNHGTDIWNQACNKDFSEGKSFTFRVGRCDARVYTCKVTTGWRDWSSWYSVVNH